MAKQKGELTRKNFKERKLIRKWFLVTKGEVNRQYWYPGGPIHTHNPPRNFTHQEINQKGACT